MPNQYSSLCICLLLAFSPATGLRADIEVDLGRGPVLVNVPPSYDPATPAPLVMVLHGYTSSGEETESYLQLTELSDQRGFVYVYPDGTTDVLNNRFWNATDACCDFFFSDEDDSSYLRQLIEEIRFLLNIDQDRIAVAGHSNGGFMAYRLACDHSEILDAAISLAGATFDDPADCNPEGFDRSPQDTVRVLQIHGTADATILYNGGATPAGSYPSAVETTAQWAAFNGCDPVPDDSSPPIDLDGSLAGDESLISRYENGCFSGGSAELWTIQGGEHVPDLSDDFRPLLMSFLFGDSLFADGFESGDLTAWSASSP